MPALHHRGARAYPVPSRRTAHGVLPSAQNQEHRLRTERSLLHRAFSASPQSLCRKHSSLRQRKGGKSSRFLRHLHAHLPHPMFCIPRCTLHPPSSLQGPPHHPRNFPKKNSPEKAVTMKMRRMLTEQDQPEESPLSLYRRGGREGEGEGRDAWEMREEILR